MNKHIFTGHVGRDPEVRTTQNGTKVWNFSVAVNGYSGGQKTTSWYKVAAFGDRWEKLMGYIGKGSSVAVCGTPSQKTWTKKDGGEGVSWEVMADTVDLLPSTGGNPKDDDIPGNNPGGSRADDQDVPF